MTKTWLMRRSVRRPVAFAVTARISSSVCRLPFISSSPLAFVDQLDGLAAAASLCGASTISKPPMSRPCLRGRVPDLRRRPDQDRLDDAGFGRLDGAAQRGLVAGMHDDGRRWRHALRGRDQAVVLASSRLGRARIRLSCRSSLAPNFLRRAYDAFALADRKGRVDCLRRRRCRRRTAARPASGALATSPEISRARRQHFANRREGRRGARHVAAAASEWPRARLPDRAAA